MTHKYNARVTLCDGYRFDSLAEARRYRELKLLEKAGEIRYLLVHPRYAILDKFTDSAGRKHRAIVYEADFSYVETATGANAVEDIKGVATAVWRLKEKMFLYRYPQLDLRVIKC
jgi:hypothetical protein